MTTEEQQEQQAEDHEVQPEESVKDSSQLELHQIVDRVIVGISEGALDDRLPEIRESIRSRQDARKEEVAELVREVFGPDAEIQIPISDSQARKWRLDASTIRRNPFEDKAKREQESEMEGEDRPVPDALASEEMDKVEQSMSPTANIPPEQRGAVISGMRASDMGG